TADTERAVLDGDLDVIGIDPRERRLDDERVLGIRHIERETVLGSAIRYRRRADKTVFEQPIHRLSKRNELAKGRGTAHECHFVHLLCVVVFGAWLAAHLVPFT